MVSKAKATKGSAQAIDYILADKGRAVELDRYAISEFSGAKILAEMREFQALNPRCLNNTYSIVLSPGEGRKYTNDELREYGREHLKNLGLDKHQYLMTAHHSTTHPHIHIIANRIGLQGNTHNDSFIGKKAQASAEKIAISHGMATAKQVSKERAEEVNEDKKAIIEEYKMFKALYGDEMKFSSYIQGMKRQKIDIELSKNKKGEVQGLRYVHRKSGKVFKASKIGKEYTLPGLAKKGMKIDMPLTVNVQKAVDKEVLKYREWRKKEEELKLKNEQVKIRAEAARKELERREEERKKAEERKKQIIEEEEQPRKRRGLRR